MHFSFFDMVYWTFFGCTPGRVVRALLQLIGILINTQSTKTANEFLSLGSSEISLTQQRSAQLDRKLSQWMSSVCVDCQVLWLVLSSQPLQKIYAQYDAVGYNCFIAAAVYLLVGAFSCCQMKLNKRRVSRTAHFLFSLPSMTPLNPRKVSSN